MRSLRRGGQCRSNTLADGLAVAVEIQIVALVPEGLLYDRVDDLDAEQKEADELKNRHSPETDFRHREPGCCEHLENEAAAEQRFVRRRQRRISDSFASSADIEQAVQVLIQNPERRLIH